jgi:hypothetical protein
LPGSALLSKKWTSRLARRLADLLKPDAEAAREEAASQ